MIVSDHPLSQLGAIGRGPGLPHKPQFREISPPSHTLIERSQIKPELNGARGGL